MRRALSLVVLTLVLAGGAHAQALRAFGSPEAFAAFGRRLVAWQGHLDSTRARIRAEERLVTQAKNALRCDSVATVTIFPDAIVPTPGRAAVVAGQVVDLWTGEAMPDAGASLSDSLASFRGRETLVATARAGDRGRFEIPVGAVAMDSVRALVGAHSGYRLTSVRLALSPGDSAAAYVPLCPGPGQTPR